MKNLDLTKPVQTRQGQPVRVLCSDRAHPEYPVIALVRMQNGTEFLETYTADGKRVPSAADDSLNNLVNVPQKIEGWLNFYADGSFSQYLHSIRENADDIAEGAKDRVACVKISYTEGEGL